MYYVPPNLSDVIHLLKQEAQPTLPLNIKLKNVSGAVSSVVSPESFISSTVSSGAILSKGSSPYGIDLVVLERRDVYSGFIEKIVLRANGEINTPITLSPYGYNAQILSTKNLVANHYRDLYIYGIGSSLGVGTALIYNSDTVVDVSGFNTTQFGSASVINKNKQLLASGINASLYGDPSIYNHTRYIEHYGGNYGLAGSPTVWFRTRYANPQSWQSLTIGDESTVTHGVREIIADGFIQQEYGTPWVSRGTRLLEPTSIYTDLPSNHLVGRHQEIKPYGYVATLFGTRIIPESQSLYPTGFTTVFGLAVADLATKYVMPKGYLSAGDQPAFRWGRQIVYNSIQYIIQNFDGGNGLVPPKWSDWQSVENRNKTIGAIGHNSLRFGYAQIDNNARLLEPQGLLATHFDESMIAYRIRKLPLQGIEPPYMAGWHIIHNGARVIAPKGEVQSLFGNAEAIKTRRYLDRIGSIDSFESGVPMIAYRIRKLDIEKRYSIAPPIIRMPTVDLHTRYVEFNGYETAKYGLASLSIHFRIITPRWAHNEKSGVPALRNVTPSLLINGHDSQEYGNAKIRTQWRNVYAQGNDSSAIGLLKISDTKQRISVRGFIDSLASQQHTVTKTGSAPYSLQYIWLHDEDGSNQGEGYGIAPPKMAEPALNQNVLYHHSDDISSRFGTQFVWSNNITVFGGIGIDGVSKLLTVTNKNNTVSVEGIDNSIACGYPRLSPHTIYSVMEAPEQAKGNHTPIGDPHYVGGVFRGNHTVGEVFGSAFIESTIRHLHPYWYGTPSSGTGIPSIELSRKMVKPNGIRLGRFGVPAIPFTLQSIGLREGIYTGLFGSVELTRPPYTGPQYVVTSDFYSTVFGGTYSDNYIRTLSVAGLDSLSMGYSKSNDSPFMWQGLRIGEHVPLIIGGGDMSSYGDANISLRVREVVAKGFNAFISQYDISAFDGRMTVSNADKQLPAINNIAVSGIESNNIIGYQDIKLGQHYIRPDGNSDQFRKGAF